MNRNLTILAYCASIIVVGKIIFVFIPNLEVVTFLLIIYTLVLGLKKSLYIAAIYSIIEFIIWGLGPQMYIWFLIVILTYLFKRIFKENFLLWSIFSAILGLSFGFLCAIPYIFIYDVSYAIAYFFYGLLFDVFHMLGNYFIMLFIGKIIYINLNKIIINIGGHNENIHKNW